MIFFGDVISSFDNTSRLFDISLELQNKLKIVNLESLIVEDKNVTKITRGIALNNNMKVIDFLVYTGVKE